MKNKEEPSVNSRRGNPCEQADLDRSDCVGSQTTGSLSRPGRTVAARTEQPALSDFSELLRGSPVKVQKRRNANKIRHF